MYINYTLSSSVCTTSTKLDQRNIEVSKMKVLYDPTTGDVSRGYDLSPFKNGLTLTVLEKWCVLVGYDPIAYFDTREEAEALNEKLIQDLKENGESVVKV